MNMDILNNEVQDFLAKHANDNPKSIALKKSPFVTVNSSELATQLESRQRVQKKLPLWFGTPGIYFPPSLSIEQASSEETATYKAGLIAEGSSLLDLTGGIGVDSFYFSRRAKKVVHCELNPDLSAIAKHNATVLAAENIEFFDGDGLEFLNRSEVGAFQTLYIDPSRRVNTRKVFMLRDCEPNIVEIQGQLLRKASTVIIKTAPLLDISLTLTELESVKEVHIISLKNECKEVLFILVENFTKSPILKAVGLGHKGVNFEFSFRQEEEKEATATFSIPQNYLFDPDTALLKAGCFKLLSQRYAIDKIHVNTHLYTSANPLPDFPGRGLKIKEVLEYKDFKKRKDKWKANVVSRNFPLKVEELRKKHKIEESELDFLYFCKGLNEVLYVLLAKRLS